MPLLEDLYTALLTQEEPEARHVAAALEIYVKGSLNIFNHRTNVDIHNRIVCFDIKQLGKQLKKLGMLIVQDAVWGRVTANRDVGKSTRYYIESLERRIQEAEAAEVNEMVRSARVTPEQLAALLRQSATTTPTPAALSAVGATFNNREDSNDEDDE